MCTHLCHWTLIILKIVKPTRFIQIISTIWSEIIIKHSGIRMTNSRDWEIRLLETNKVGWVAAGVATVGFTCTTGEGEAKEARVCLPRPSRPFLSPPTSSQGLWPQKGKRSSKVSGCSWFWVEDYDPHPKGIDYGLEQKRREQTLIYKLISWTSLFLRYYPANLGLAPFKYFSPIVVLFLSLKKKKNILFSYHKCMTMLFIPAEIIPSLPLLSSSTHLVFTNLHRSLSIFK